MAFISCGLASNHKPALVRVHVPSTIDGAADLPGSGMPACQSARACLLFRPLVFFFFFLLAMCCRRPLPNLPTLALPGLPLAGRRPPPARRLPCSGPRPPPASSDSPKPCRIASTESKSNTAAMTEKMHRERLGHILRRLKLEPSGSVSSRSPHTRKLAREKAWQCDFKHAWNCWLLQLLHKSPQTAPQTAAASSS